MDAEEARKTYELQKNNHLSFRANDWWVAVGYLEAIEKAEMLEEELEESVNGAPTGDCVIVADYHSLYWATQEKLNKALTKWRATR